MKCRSAWLAIRPGVFGRFERCPLSRSDRSAPVGCCLADCDSGASHDSRRDQRSRNGGLISARLRLALCRGGGDHADWGPSWPWLDGTTPLECAARTDAGGAWRAGSNWTVAAVGGGATGAYWVSGTYLGDWGRGAYAVRLAPIRARNRTATPTATSAPSETKAISTALRSLVGGSGALACEDMLILRGGGLWLVG
jgi:hypothetical protein